MTDPRVLRRLRWMLDHRLQYLASEAVEVLATLMRESDDNRVKLRAATEILERAGVRPTEQEEVTAAFQVVVNLGPGCDSQARE